MSRSCQQGDVLQPGEQVRAQHPGQARDRLGRDRVPLVRHRRRALLARLEPLLHLAHLGALEVAELDRHQLARGADRGTGVQQLGVAVAGDHLGGGHRAETEGQAHMGLHRRGHVRVRADGTAQLHHGDRAARCPQPLTITVDLERPQRDLGAERGGLGVDPVRAADHHRVAVLRARSISVPSSALAASTSRSAASRICQHNVVSPTSDDVSP